MATFSSTISISPGVIVSDLDGESVILNVETGKYYGLNLVGTRMWTLLAQHGQVAPAYAALQAEYDVTADKLEWDLLTLVDNLASQQLLAIVEP